MKEAVEPSNTATDEARDAKLLIGAGVGVGVLGVAGTAIAGVVCPICIVVSPTLIGAGMLKRRKASKINKLNK